MATLRCPEGKNGGLSWGTAWTKDDYLMLQQTYAMSKQVIFLREKRERQMLEMGSQGEMKIHRVVNIKN